MRIARWRVGGKSQQVNRCQALCQLFTARCSCVLIEQNGIALVLALVLIMLMSILGLYGAIGSQTDLRISHNDQLAKRTWDVADGGVRHGFRILGQATSDAWSNGFSDELSNGGVGGSLGSAGGTVTTIDGQQYVFFSFGGSNAADGYYVRAEDNFDDADQTTDKDQRIRIIARGQVGDAVKIIEALTVPPVKCALTANGDTLLSGNSMSSNVQVNTLDGNGACVHTNEDLKIQGSANFPDGATASGIITACSGNPSIGSGSCDQAKDGQPIQYIPIINPGEWAQYVANLGIASPSGPYYILNSRGTINNSDGTSKKTHITKGGKCRVIDPNPSLTDYPNYPWKYESTAITSVSLPGTAAATTPVGQCIDGIWIQNSGATATEYQSIAGGGGGQGTIDLGTDGVCKVKNLPDGVYYCDGKFDLTGPIDGNVTLISRDDIEMASQSSFVSYLPRTTAETAITNQTALTAAITSAGSLANYRTQMGGLPASYNTNDKITDLGKYAYAMLSNFSLVAGKDIKMVGGTQVTVQGIIFAHDEVYLSGNKDITGYIMAGSGLPTFPGDPNPPSTTTSGSGDGIEIDTLSGNVVLNYRPFATNFPLGPPAMIAWHDNMPKN